MIINSIKFALVLSIAVCSACSASVSSYSDAPTLPSAAITETDPEVRTALEYISKAPDSTLGYQQLAVVYIKRSRETGDSSYHEKAETAVKKALEIAPDDVTSKKLNATLLLALHRFAQARDLATQMQKENPTDAFIFGVLTDANAELGDYDAAAAAVQKMVDLRPNSSAYARVAHIRSLNGEHQGAVEMYKLAARTADPQDREAQSWCLVQLANEYWKYGKFKESEKVLDEALANFPKYHLAEIGKGRVLNALGKTDEAIKYLTAVNDRSPDADISTLLGDIYFKLGNTSESQKFYQLGEELEADAGEGEAKHMAMLWANRDHRLDEVLATMEKEYVRQQDVYTEDAYAWALYKNGKFAEAKEMNKKSMRIKANEPLFFYHAGMIEKALGNNKAAVQMLEKALKQNPAFDLVKAEAAKTALIELRSAKRV